MSAGLDGLEFLQYAWGRRAMAAITCFSAVVLTGLISIFLPLRYTATASVLIESPGGNDPRAATAVSPVYLESLKTYELMASSDSLFARALDDFHLREAHPHTSIESLKRKILSVSKPTNTNIVEISATLEDPRQAQALAQYLAEHTVELNAQMDQQSNRQITEEPQRIFDDAAARLARAKKAEEEFTKTSSIARISKEVEADELLQSDLQRDLSQARTELGENLARQQTPNVSGSDDDAARLPAAIAATRARIRELETQTETLRKELAEKEPALAGLIEIRDTLDSELSQAREGEEVSQNKLSDVQASAGFRGVHLKVLDPGVVPQRPTFPNTPLNMTIALAVSLIGNLVFLAIQFGYGRVRRTLADPIYTLR